MYFYLLISFIVFQINISEKPNFTTGNKNVFQGEIDSNITVRIWVESYSSIQYVQLCEIKNESNIAEMYGLLINHASVESCHQ